MGKYSRNNNASFYIFQDPSNRKIRLETIMQGINTNNSLFVQKTPRGAEVTVIPSNRFILPVDSSKVLDNGTVKPESADEIVSPLEWTVPRGQKTRSNLVQLDILSNFDWERPVYFVAAGNEGSLNLEEFFQLEGLAYRLVPISTPGRNFFNYGRIEPDILHQNLMEEFSWGRMNEEDFNMDYYNRRTFTVIRFRKNFVRLAESWLAEGDTVKAEQVLDRCMELATHSKLPYDYYVSGLSYPDSQGNLIEESGIIETYYRCGAIEKANELLLEFSNILLQDIQYYQALKPRHRQRFSNEYYQSRGMYERLLEMAEQYGQEQLIMQG